MKKPAKRHASSHEIAQAIVGYFVGNIDEDIVTGETYPDGYPFTKDDLKAALRRELKIESDADVDNEVSFLLGREVGARCGGAR